MLSELTLNPSQPDAKNSSIEWIEKRIYEQKTKMFKEMRYLDADSKEIVVIENKLSVIDYIKDELDRKIFVALVNDVFSSNDYNGEISTFKEYLSDDITKKAKEIIVNNNEEWEKYDQRRFLNSLRKHVRGDELEHEWNNDLYSSIAAVITNGDDWQNLLRFMQSK